MIGSRRRRKSRVLKAIDATWRQEFEMPQKGLSPVQMTITRIFFSPLQPHRQPNHPLPLPHGAQALQQTFGHRSRYFEDLSTSFPLLLVWPQPIIPIDTWGTTCQHFTQVHFHPLPNVLTFEAACLLPQASARLNSLLPPRPSTTSAC